MELDGRPAASRSRSPALATARPRSLPGLGCSPAAPRSRSPLPMTDQEHQPPLLRGKPGSPTTPPQRFSGQGLILCLGPCPHFGLPGTSNGQGPHHEIRPCPSEGNGLRLQGGVRRREGYGERLGGREGSGERGRGARQGKRGARASGRMGCRRLLRAYLKTKLLSEVQSL